VSAAGGRAILRVGLTGGISSGKTTVASFMAEMGAFVLDADKLAHELMAPGGTAFEEVVHRFGGDPNPHGIDRRKRSGNASSHDATERESARRDRPSQDARGDRGRIGRYQATGHSNVAVVDAALLVESGAYRKFQRLVVVRCSRDAQLQRLMARSGLAAEDALARIESQYALEAKLAVADYVVDTDATIRETRHQTEQVYQRLLQDYGRLFGGPGATLET
jgi:dephospho-CoA kinase